MCVVCIYITFLKCLSKSDSVYRNSKDYNTVYILAILWIINSLTIRTAGLARFRDSRLCLSVSVRGSNSGIKADTTGEFSERNCYRALIIIFTLRSKHGPRTIQACLIVCHPSFSMVRDG